MNNQLPSKWQKKAFKEVAEVITGTTPPKISPEYYGGVVPFITPTELHDNGLIMEASTFLSDSGVKRARLLPVDTILVTCIGTLGKVGIAGQPLVTNQQINSLIFDTKVVFPKYAYFYCKTIKPVLETLAPSTTVAIINKSKFSEIKIPLPPLAEQKQIAAILDKADTIRRKRKQAIKLADDFLRATFLDMFGDPKSNKGNRPMTELGKIAQIIMGQSPAGESYNGIGEGVPLLNGPVEFGEKYPKEKQWTTQPTKYSDAGDILFCVRGATAGRMNWADKQYCIGRGLAAIRGKGNISNHFVYKFLEFMYPYFQSTSDGSTFINIPSNVLNTLPMPNPTEEEEVKFTSLSRLVEKFKEHFEISLENAEKLFNSLTQRAFRGEL